MYAEWVRHGEWGGNRTDQSHVVSGPLERSHRLLVTHFHRVDAVHRRDDVVHSATAHTGASFNKRISKLSKYNHETIGCNAPKSPVALRSATCRDFGDEDTRVVGDVRHVGATRNAEAQTHAARLQANVTSHDNKFREEQTTPQFDADSPSPERFLQTRSGGRR